MHCCCQTFCFFLRQTGNNFIKKIIILTANFKKLITVLLKQYKSLDH